MNLPVEEAIKTLKAEIIAQDWRISPKRVEIIDSSLSCLQQHFKDRKATHAMVAMAIGVLEYIKKKGGNPPATIDFVKEAMAHVVGQYEDLKYDQKREEEIFKTLFKHFTSLKEKIKTGGKTVPKKTASSPPAPPNITPIAERSSSEIARDQPPPQTDTHQSAIQVENYEADRLIEDLKDSLEKAGAVGSTIGDLLNQLIATQARKELAAKNQPHEQEQQSPRSTKQSSAPIQHDNLTEIEKHNDICPTGNINKCPPTELRQITVGNSKVAILENTISALKPVNKSQLTTYIKNSSVPIKNFNKLFQGLANQFKGPLNKVRHGKLKKLSLPLMIPQGLDLPSEPDGNSTNLLVIFNGNWHGVIACSKPSQKPANMVKFKKSKNGDIAGTGYLEDDSQITLLDSLSVLRREGFLITPP